MEFDIIKQAVVSNRGGLETATDNEILTIWNSLDQEQQETYLKKIKRGRIKKDAVNSGTKRNTKGSPGPGQEKTS